MFQITNSLIANICDNDPVLCLECNEIYKWQIKWVGSETADAFKNFIKFIIDCETADPRKL